MSKNYDETFKHLGLTAISGSATGAGLSFLFNTAATGSALAASLTGVGVAACAALTAFNGICAIRAFIRERGASKGRDDEPPKTPRP